MLAVINPNYLTKLSSDTQKSGLTFGQGVLKLLLGEK
jgi:hypothetical protein